MSDKKSEWLRSKDARRVINTSTCELAHLREDGKIRHHKEGNAYLYMEKDLMQIASLRDKAHKD